MFELEPKAHFIIFTLISLGVAIGQHSHFAMYIYMLFIALVGFLSWVSFKRWENGEDDDFLN